MIEFPGRLAIQQRVLPDYRAGLMERLAAQCRGGLDLFAGAPLRSERIPPSGPIPGVRRTAARNIHLFHPRHPLYACWQPGLRRWIARTDPDVLIIEANPRYLSTPTAIAWMRQAGKPVLGWGLGAPDVRGPAAGRRRSARLRLLEQLDGVIAYSQRGAAEYKALGVFPEDRIFVAPNAVAPAPTRPAPSRGPLEHPARVLFVGRLQARKRLDLLFKACAALPREIKPVITIVGDGPDRSDFESLARRIYPQANFLGEQRGRALAEAFAAADLFVLPGTGGLAVQEAMSYALPVIVAEGDGTQADLVRADNGWLVRPGDPEALRRALAEALCDQNLRARGQASRRIVDAEINLETMAEAMLLASAAVAGNR